MGVGGARRRRLLAVRADELASLAGDGRLDRRVYHIATMLSLHEWFNEIGSPVPRFLILDQPSQAGFPDETRGGGFGSARATLLNLYETIQASIESLAGAFQVIVLEHADLDEEHFRSAVRARWRRGNGEALVPAHWITHNSDE
ncbi:DUF3732 domain-containing protein [Streptomyces niveus]|uniref:DUF3732 domain-containing protein n=1 Tax=Streptomyces niveus TaxID=193462 RepID=UPI000B32F121|nr:DUF3732 domain-containing protein [Streptomyces niveus]